MWSKRFGALVLTLLLSLSLLLPAFGAEGEETAAEEPAEETAEAEERAPACLPIPHSTWHAPFVRGFLGTFRPDEVLTRAEGVQMIYAALRAEGAPMTEVSGVTPGVWYHDAACTLAAGGLLDGTEDFRAEETLSRGAFVALLAGLAPEDGSERSFSDVPADSVYRGPVSRAAAQGWIAGFPDGTFRPDAGITRAEAVTVLNNVLDREPDRAAIDRTLLIPLFEDVAKSDWAYYEITEAALSHTAERAGETETWTGDDSSRIVYSPGIYYFGGETYCIGADGHPITNAASGTLYFGADGRYTSGDAEIDGYAREILRSLYQPGMNRATLLRRAFDYTRDNYTYLRRHYYRIGDVGWTLEEGRVMFETGRGNCYCFTSVFYYLARQLGYDAVAVSGVVGGTRSPHGWVEIDFDGTTYIFDTELEMAYRKKGNYSYNLFMMPYSSVPWPYVKA